MEDLNKGILCTGNIPQNKWEYGRYKEIYENRYKESLKRLETFKQGGLETEDRMIEYIWILESIIDSKNHIRWIDRGHRQLILDKIQLLESML